MLTREEEKPTTILLKVTTKAKSSAHGVSSTKEKVLLP